MRHKFEPHIFDFDAIINYENLELGQNRSESDSFLPLFNDDLVEHIAQETNWYCNQWENECFANYVSQNSIFNGVFFTNFQISISLDVYYQ